MTKLVCSKCEVELLIAKSGVAVIEHASFGPYKLWMADEWRCPNCGATIIAGFGDKAASEHYQPSFVGTLASLAQHPEIVRHDYENQAQRAEVHS